MKFRKDFIGLDGFYWWVGVVENRKDPLGLGRCQVRVFGAHTENLTDIPSDDLPWAHPVHALNNQAFSTPREGEYVFGFFLDGKLAQSPVMMGIVPGIPAESTDPNLGFADLRTNDDIADSPKKPESLSFATDGSGVAVTEIQNQDALSNLRFPSQSQVTHPTNSNLARNENVTSTLIQDRRKNLVSVEGANGTSWDEPFPAYAAEYPYNKVTETESGHIFELDDTPKAERIHIAHRAGSFQEYYPSGSKVEKIVKNNYRIVLSDDHIYVAGRVNIVVESDANIKVVGDVNIEGQGDLNVGVAGDAKFTVGGDFKLKASNVFVDADSDINQLAGGSYKVGSFGSIDIKSSGNMNVDGSKINLNDGTSSFASTSGLSQAPSLGSPTSAAPYIEATPADRAAYFVDAGEGGEDAHIKEQLDKGIYTPEQVESGKTPIEGESNADTPPKLDSVSDCGGIEFLSSFPDSLQLSVSFTLGQLTGRAPCGDPLREQRDLTKGQIACNLKLLAINCLDKIKAQYPTMIVTNAFRYPVGAAAGRSQHEIGQAADLQFPSFSKSQYYDIVLWIRDNVPHDQLLLEYKTFGTGQPWIHISFNKNGNRVSSSSKNMTFMNHKPYKPFFVNLAS